MYLLMWHESMSYERCLSWVVTRFFQYQKAKVEDWKGRKVLQILENICPNLTKPANQSVKQAPAQNPNHHHRRCRVKVSPSLWI